MSLLRSLRRRLAEPSLGVAVLGLAAAAALLPARAQMPGVTRDVLTEYYDNTLIWQDLTTRAVGRLWLDGDGHFFVFYNMGPQPRPPDISGPFQVEGRWGTYTLRHGNGAYQLCLWPAAPRTRIDAEVQHEVFAQSACYPFAAHKPGDVWAQTADTLGRPYRFWLVSGR